MANNLIGLGVSSLPHCAYRHAGQSAIVTIQGALSHTACPGATDMTRKTDGELQQTRVKYPNTTSTQQVLHWSSFHHTKGFSKGLNSALSPRSPQDSYKPPCTNPPTQLPPKHSKHVSHPSIAVSLTASITRSRNTPHMQQALHWGSPVQA